MNCKIDLGNLSGDYMNTYYSSHTDHIKTQLSQNADKRESMA